MEFSNLRTAASCYKRIEEIKRSIADLENARSDAEQDQCNPVHIQFQTGFIPQEGLFHRMTSRDACFRVIEVIIEELKKEMEAIRVEVSSL